mgnify:CR=1 FL=1
MQEVQPTVVDRPVATVTPAAADSDQPIVLEGVSRHFDDQVALEDVSMAVPAGCILGVIGPSGAMKNVWGTARTP